MAYLHHAKIVHCKCFCHNKKEEVHIGGNGYINWLDFDGYFPRYIYQNIS